MHVTFCNTSTILSFIYIYIYIYVYIYIYMYIYIYINTEEFVTLLYGKASLYSSNGVFLETPKIYQT